MKRVEKKTNNKLSILCQFQQNPCMRQRNSVASLVAVGAFVGARIARAGEKKIRGKTISMAPILIIIIIIIKTKHTMVTLYGKSRAYSCPGSNDVRIPFKAESKWMCLHGRNERSTADEQEEERKKTHQHKKWTHNGETKEYYIYFIKEMSFLL